jgi:MarR family transcriptional regulator, lower aerobic nicotinate degradation pathway regulator
MTIPREPAELLESTGYLLARVGSESRSRFVEALAGQDLTLAAYSVMMILGGTTDITQRELAAAVGIDPRNLVPILDDLEARGLLTRGAHPADRRRHAVKLTKAGQTQLIRLAEIGASAEMELLRPLSKQERKQLHSLLTRLL